MSMRIGRVLTSFCLNIECMSRGEYRDELQEFYDGWREKQGQNPFSDGFPILFPLSFLQSSCVFVESFYQQLTESSYLFSLMLRLLAVLRFLLS